MSRAAAGEQEGQEELEGAVEQEVAVFEEIDKLTEFAISATDVKKYAAAQIPRTVRGLSGVFLGPLFFSDTSRALFLFRF